MHLHPIHATGLALILLDLSL